MWGIGSLVKLQTGLNERPMRHRFLPEGAIRGYGPRRSGGVIKVGLAGLFSILLFACANPEATRTGSLGSAVANLSRDSKDATGSGPWQTEPDSASRVFWASDMKLHTCATLGSDGRIIGEACPPTIVVFGPYVAVAAKSNVRVQFDLEVGDNATLIGDVVSGGAKQFHAAIEGDLSVDEQRSFSYRIQIFEDIAALETRAGFGAEGPLDFAISNLKLTIE